jgi:hypothetical protein
MSQQPDPVTTAKNIIDENIYMVLGTVNETGIPWVSPLYYAARRYTDFYWVSSPAARHSVNLALRHQVSIVIFDSRAQIGTGQGVYMEAVACELTETALEDGIEVFSRASIADGAGAWILENVRAPAQYRLYKATVTGHWVLGSEGHPDRRIQIAL